MAWERSQHSAVCTRNTRLFTIQDYAIIDYLVVSSLHAVITLVDNVHCIIKLNDSTFGFIVDYILAEHVIMTEDYWAVMF